MKLPRRKFLHLAAGAAALPAMPHVAWAKGTTVIWVHSIYGKRPAIDKEKKWLKGLGHTVYAPDLYRGWCTDNEDAGGEYMKNQGGFKKMLERLEAATKRVSSAVWAGWSMGAYLAQEMAQKRAKDKDPKRRPIGLLLMSFGLIAPAPFGVKGVRVGVQVHATKGDIQKEELKDSECNGAEIFHYEGDGHIFADDGLPDYNRVAEAEWKTNVENFLKAL
jgi:pimeloyl-ACP methyl ester carboxylesterase